jgi:prolyl oligopeptidase
MPRHSLRVSWIAVIIALEGCGRSVIAVERRASPATPAREYPAARRSDVVDELHGERVADPYRWLEELAAPETRAWVSAEHAVTRRWFEGIASRERIARELAEANDFERTAFSPKKRGTRWFFAQSSGHQDQPVLVVADSLLGEPRVVADFNAISPDGKLAYAGSSVSPRGTYVAYGLSIGGSDWVEWRVRDVASGRDLPDRVEWTKYYWPSWAADETGLYYSRFPKNLVNVDDVPEIGLEYHPAIVNYCMQQAYELDEDLQGAQYSQQQFNTGMATIAENENKINDDLYPTITVSEWDR